MPKGFRKVDTIRHRELGVEVALRLNFETMEFHAEYGGKRFVDKDGDKVRDQVLAHVEKESAVTWELVIRVRNVSDRVSRAREGENLRVAGVAFEYRRFWLGRIASGRMVQVEYDVADSRRLELSKDFKPKARETLSLAERGGVMDYKTVHERRNMLPPNGDTFTLPWREYTDPIYHGGGDTYLAYSLELWHGLESIADAIDRERAQLENLVNNVDAFDLVAQLGAAALPRLITAGVAGSSSSEHSSDDDNYIDPDEVTTDDDA